MRNKPKIKNLFDTHLKRNLIIFFAVIGTGFSLFFYAVLHNRGEVSSIEFSSELEARISRLVSGYPIEVMAPFISKEDRIVASYLVAIAKKESNWGKLSPKKDGRDCYNYWGYRGTYNQTDSGYSCFDTPEQAVSVVGERIGEFVSKKIDTPKKMANAWKCGFDCSGHSFWSVMKWEWDVGYYFKKVYN